jgi:hypothetical protein
MKFIQKLLHREPGQRRRTFTEMLDAVEDFCGREWKWVLPLAVLILLALLLAA